MVRWMSLVVVVGAVAWAASALSEDAPPTGVERRVTVMERKLDVLTARLEESGKDLRKSHEDVKRLTAYVAAQATAAAKMSKVLDASEQAGFTYGMNAESRIGLLRGWRAQLDATIAGLDAGKAEKPAAEETDR